MKNFIACSLLIVLISSLMLPACSGNTVVISSFYNRAGNSLAKRFYLYADFSAEQRDEIQSAVEHYHHWHRKQQIPLYIIFLKDIQNTISTEQGITVDRVEQWGQRLRSFRTQLDDCNPVNYASPFLAELDDAQVQQFSSRFKQLEHEKNKKTAGYSKVKLEQRRLDKALKGLKRIGLRLDDEQTGWLTATLYKNQGLNEQWDRLEADWKKDFIALLEQRNRADFATNMQQHVNKLSAAGEPDYTQAVAANRARWYLFTHQLINSLSEKQEVEFLGFLMNFTQALDKIYKSEVTKNQNHKLNLPDHCL